MACYYVIWFLASSYKALPIVANLLGMTTTFTETCGLFNKLWLSMADVLRLLLRLMGGILNIKIIH